jgi:ABC-type phosphate/phosphonate transport system substrate-binding protein
VRNAAFFTTQRRRGGHDRFRLALAERQLDLIPIDSEAGGGRGPAQHDELWR